MQVAVQRANVPEVCVIQPSHTSARDQQRAERAAVGATLASTARTVSEGKPVNGGGVKLAATAHCSLGRAQHR